MLYLLLGAALFGTWRLIRRRRRSSRTPTGPFEDGLAAHYRDPVTGRSERGWL